VGNENVNPNVAREKRGKRRIRREKNNPEIPLSEVRRGWVDNHPRGERKTGRKGLVAAGKNRASSTDFETVGDRLIQ